MPHKKSPFHRMRSLANSSTSLTSERAADLQSIHLTSVHRKKFLKMRHTFKDKMRDNGRLYEAEQHSRRIARRLQEQNEYV